MRLRNGLLGFVLALMLLLVGLGQTPAHAQTYTYQVLHDFFGGFDGDTPLSNLVRDHKGILYGTTTGYATSGANGGTVFESIGNLLVTLHQFSGPDGAEPQGSLVVDANGVLYGTTSLGGLYGNGTIFKIDTLGGFWPNFPFQTLYSFSYADGTNPVSSLLLDNQGHLFGTTSGGVNSFSTVFRIDTSGNNFQVLHYFNANVDKAYGAYPGLVLDNQGVLYGTTVGNYGAIYALDTQGNNFRILHSFTDGTDGGYPYSTLALDGQGHLYGVAGGGGNGGNAGVVFAINTSGSNFSILHDFNDGSGQYPLQGLLLDNNGNLYGTTYYGGANGYGEIFTLTTAGTNFQVLHSFIGSDGENPSSYDTGLFLDDQGVLYGTTPYGGATYANGAYGSGVVYALYPGTVQPGYLSVNVANAGAVIGQTVTLKATVRSQSDDTLLSGRTLVFHGIDGSILGTAVTDSNGIASFSYQVPAPARYLPLPQLLSLWVHSPGDAQYQANNGYGWLMVSAADTYFQVANVTGAVGQTVTLSAVFYRSSDNTPLPNKTVQMFIGYTHVGNTVTDSTGTAHFSYKIPDTVVSGTQTITFKRFTDAQYNSSQATGTLTVTPANIYFQVANVTGARGQTVTLSAVFYLASDNAALPHKTVSFGIDGVHTSDTVTDGTGTASIIYTIPKTMSVGKHTIIFTRFTDAQFHAGQGTGTLTVTP